MATVHDIDFESINQSKLEHTEFLSGASKKWWVEEIWKPAEDFCVRHRIKPNTITFVGFLLVGLAAFLIATGHFVMAGWVIFIGGSFDFLDGRVARRLNCQTDGGAFFDSVMDRYMDAALYVGLSYYFQDSWFFWVVLTGFIGSMITPYIRAKAESLGVNCREGAMQRAERVLYVGLGAVMSGYLMCLSYPFMQKGEELPPYFLMLAVSMIAFASNKVALERFWHTFKQLDP